MTSPNGSIIDMQRQLLLLPKIRVTSAEGDFEDVRRYAAGTFHSIILGDVVMTADSSSRVPFSLSQ
jgi:hypothetical protein